MSKIIITIVMTLAGLISQAQVSESRKANAFTKLEVESGIEVFYMESNENAIRIEADSKEQLENIVTEIEGKTLRVYYAKNKKTVDSAKVLKVFVAANNVNSFKASSKSKIVFEKPIKSEEIKIEILSGSSFNGMVLPNLKTIVKVSSGSIFVGKFETDYFQGDFKSGATVALSGSAKKSVINTSSGAYCNAKNFFTENTIAKANGLSSALINAKKLDAKSLNSSSITFFGSLDNVKTNEESLSISSQIMQKETEIVMNYNQGQKSKN